jgi:cytochrome P450 family 110
MKIRNQTLPNGSDMPIFLRQMKMVFQPLKYMEDFAKTYGDNFTIKSKNGDNIVYFSHPQALEQIFTTDANKLDAGRGNDILRYLLGSNSVVLLDGQTHRKQRKLLAPSFHGDRMRTYGQAIAEISRQVSSYWEDGKGFNIRHSMQEITMRVILRVVFGLDEGQRLEELQQAMNVLLEILGVPLISAALLFKFWQIDLGKWSPWGRILTLLEKVDELIYSHIREVRADIQANNPNRQDILSLLISTTYEDGKAMSDEELRDELITLLVLGHETTASALVWAFYWIERSQQVREKLQNELDTLAYQPEPSTISKLPYLTAVCQETLRIYPVATSSFSRIVNSPVEIMGYQLPTKTLIIPSIYLAHHREEVYPNSKQFIPERFLERQFSPYEYLPFGGGNRHCIGMAFAMYEMKIILATILSHYRVFPLDKRPVQPIRRGLTLVAPTGMKMIAKSHLTDYSI